MYVAFDFQIENTPNGFVWLAHFVAIRQVHIGNGSRSVISETDKVTRLSSNIETARS